MQGLPLKVFARRAARGFTIAELMAVVAIIAILSMIATISYRKYVAHAKTAEVIWMFAGIKIAQEAYKDETFQYLSISPDLASSNSYHPANSKPGQQEMNFGVGTSAMDQAWQRLGVSGAGPVRFVYACVAGTNTTPPSLGSDIKVANWPPPGSENGPWYVLKARGDIYGQGTMTVFATASFADSAMFKEND